MDTPSVPTVALCLPSRGLVHSRTLEAVLAALDVARERIRCVGWFLTHDLPIPDCHETTAERALAAGADYLWFVEEDMVPPPDALLLLLSTADTTGAGIVTIDYPISEHPTQSAIMHKANGSVFWCGLGCTLVHRDVFALLARPWFRSSHPGVMIRHGAHDPWHWEDLPPHAANVFAYGGQDVWLCYQALLAGITIAEVPNMVAGHARLRSWGERQTNQGAHTVDVLTRIERNMEA